MLFAASPWFDKLTVMRMKMNFAHAPRAANLFTRTRFAGAGGNLHG